MVTESIQNGGNPKLDTGKEKAPELTNSTLKQTSMVSRNNFKLYCLRNPFE